MIEQILKTNEIKVLCLQEIDVESGFDHRLPNINGYRLELEENSVKSRSGLYLSNDVVYLRKKTLEGVDSHLIIIDKEGTSGVRRIIIIMHAFTLLF